MNEVSPHVQCYPRASLPVDETECPSVPQEKLPGWFSVALWKVWPSLWPDYVGFIESPSAFAAIENTMHFYRLSWVAYASARALDGSIVYRCYKPCIVLDVEEEP
jgi:hypothetical protein